MQHIQIQLVDIEVFGRSLLVSTLLRKDDLARDSGLGALLHHSMCADCLP